MEPQPYTDQSDRMAENAEDLAAPSARDISSEGQQQREPSSDGLDTPVEEVPTPPYSSRYGEMDLSQGGFGTSTRIAEDGRVNININERSRRLSTILGRAIDSQEIASSAPLPPPYVPASLGGKGGIAPPSLNVVIQVVGSRGDVQPFIALGQALQKTYGHRIRLATHPTFKEFVEENGLEFFSIGGDPAQLMAFMVKNPGLMPGFDSLRSGDIGKRRKEITEIISGCWRSCLEAGDGTGLPITDANLFAAGSLSSGNGPFVAEAIIANPPSFAHLHCAERLGIPLHLMFTMPWSPTQAFPHPLANITSSNADARVTNLISYSLVEMMTWQGLGDVINSFRERTLGLEPISIIWAPGMIPRLRIPYTYCWSPALIPKPNDWANYIDIAGFYFLPLASNYTPPDDLAAFLDAGPPPVYIGFGSIVVDDPDAMTKLIFEAVKKTGQRALVSKGWGGFGAEEIGIPDGVHMLGNCPHDWLFKRVSCVVHHGGAGTTAAGIATGRPTVIVPFFGDQPFWGSMVARAGAGPEPMPYKELNADKLAAAIMEALTPTALEKAGELGAKIGQESGTDMGAQSFHKYLRVDTLRCDIVPSRSAVWRVRRTKIKLSAFAVTTLSSAGLLDLDDLKMYRPREYDTEPGPKDPITGGAAAIVGILGTLATSFTDIPAELLRAIPSESSKKKAKSKTKKPRSSLPSSPPSTDNSMSNLIATPDESTSSLPILTIDSDTIGTPSVDESSSEAGESVPSTGAQASQPAHTDSASHDGPGPITADTIVDTGRAASKIFNVGIRSHMNFTMGVSKGFHNAPKLYGDDTVREMERVTDIRSGFRAAGKEFGYGFYDGITGLVTQPVRGAKKEGAVGALKGFGKGIGGIVLKPAAGVFALTGYTASGLFKEIQNNFGTKVERYIAISRSAQGYEDWATATEQERSNVLNRWKIIKADLDNKSGEKGGLFAMIRSPKKDKKRARPKSGEPFSQHSRRQSGLRDVFRTELTQPGLGDANHDVQYYERNSISSPSPSPSLPPSFLTYSQRSSIEHGGDHDDADLKRVMEESKREYENAEEKERREMDIVMEYAKRQSLAEESFKRQSRTSAGSGSGSGSRAVEEDEDDEELRRATEESLKFQ